MASSCCSPASSSATVVAPADEHAVACKWDACNQTFPELQDLLQHLLTQHIDWQPRSRSANVSKHAFQFLNITVSADATQSPMKRDASTCPDLDNSVLDDRDQAISEGWTLYQRRPSEEDSKSSSGELSHHSTSPYRDKKRDSIHVEHGNRMDIIPNVDVSESQCRSHGAHSHMVLPSIDKLFPPLARSRTEYLFDGSRDFKGDDVEKDEKKRRNARLRRKWTEEEKNALIRGVGKHGLGNWTLILNDEEFFFDNRTATDLKDKFRTCYREMLTMEDVGTQQLDVLTLKDNSSGESHDEQTSTADGGESTFSKQVSGPVLGAYRPLKRSRRRERRAFDDRDDKEILEGLRRYGPAWSQIQRDASFHLSCRRPLDLRDRVRNRFPELYKRLKKNLSQQRNQKQQAREDTACGVLDLG